MRRQQTNFSIDALIGTTTAETTTTTTTPTTTNEQQQKLYDSYCYVRASASHKSNSYANCNDTKTLTQQSEKMQQLDPINESKYRQNSLGHRRPRRYNRSKQTHLFQCQQPSGSIKNEPNNESDIDIEIEVDTYLCSMNKNDKVLLNAFEPEIDVVGDDGELDKSLELLQLQGYHKHLQQMLQNSSPSLFFPHHTNQDDDNVNALKISLHHQPQATTTCASSQQTINLPNTLLAHEPFPKTQTQQHRQRPKKHLCPICKLSLSNKGQLISHVRSHTGERPFKCEHPACNKAFTRNEELTRHRRIHTGHKPYPCQICSKRFGRKDHLKKHVRTHTRRGIYHSGLAQHQQQPLHPPPTLHISSSQLPSTMYTAMPNVSATKQQSHGLFTTNETSFCPTFTSTAVAAAAAGQAAAAIAAGNPLMVGLLAGQQAFDAITNSIQAHSKKLTPSSSSSIL